MQNTPSQNPAAIESAGFPVGKRIAVIGIVLASIAVAAYANSFSGVFLFDDIIRIVEEPRVHRLFPLGPLLSGERPVVDLTLALNYAVGALNPWGYHALNFAVHILAGLTLFGIVRRTMALFLLSAGSGSPSIDNRQSTIDNLLAFAIALLFLVHPLQTQSVTYIIQRGESMMGLFYLLTLYCAIRALDAPRSWLWSLAAVLSCALGMATKAVMVTAPLVVVLYDWVFLGRGEDQRSKFKDQRKRFPLYIALFATWGILWLCGIGPEVLGKAQGPSHVGFSYQGVTAWQYALSQPGVIVQYIQLAFWPASLCLDYDWPVATHWPQIIPPAIVMAILLALTIWLLWHRHWLGFLGAWFFVILAPTSSIVPIKDLMFEHRMYLPLAGILGAVVLPVGWWLLGDGKSGNKTNDAKELSRLRGVLFLFVVSLLATPLAIATHLRNRTYHSELAMWQDVATKQPGNARAYIAIGNALIGQGKLADALETTQKAIEVAPGNADAHCAVGLNLAKSGRLEEAIASYQQAVHINPTHSRAWYNLGNALTRMGRHEEAIQAFQQSVKSNPGFADAWCNLGNAFIDQQKTDEAIPAYRRAIELDPRHAKAHNNLGDALLKLGKLEEAQKEFQEAIAIQPDYSKARLNLALLYQRLNDIENAIEQCRIILQSDPANRGAQELLRTLENQRDR